MADTNTTYLSLIKRAITNFNDIYGKLDAFKNDSVDLLSDVRVDGKVNVDNYDDAIAKLTYIVDTNGASASARINSTVVTYYDYSSTAVASGEGYTNIISAIENDENNRRQIVTAALVPAAGYYTQNSKIQTTLGLQDVTLNTTNSTLQASEETSGEGEDATVITTGYFYVVPDSSKVIGSVTLGKSNISALSAEVTNDSSDNLTTTVGATAYAKGTKDSAVITVDANAGGFALVINSEATTETNSPMAVSASVSVTEGYTTAETKTVDIGNIELSSTNDTDTTFYIQAGSVAVATATDSKVTPSLDAGIFSTPAEGATAEQIAAGYYTVTSAISDTEIQKIKTTVTEGYVTESTTALDTTKIVRESNTKYIKKGSSNGVAITDDNLNITAATNDYLADSGKEVTINVAHKGAITENITSGYIADSDTRGSISVSGTETFYIKEGSVTPKYNITEFTTGGIDGYNAPKLSTSKASSDFALTVTPTISLSGTVVPGWVDSVDWAAAEEVDNANLTKEIYIPAATHTVSDFSFSATATNVNASEGEVDDGAATSNNLNLFLDSVSDISGDYYTVVTSLNVSLTEGYTTGIKRKVTNGSETTTANDQTYTLTKYVPKATIEFVENTDGEGYYNVISGGYLPSGVLEDISTATSLSFAQVGLTRNAESTITAVAIAEGEEDNYHKFIVSKGTVKSGYISDKQGTITGETFYVNKAGVTTATSMTSSVQDIKRDTTNNKYSFPIKVTATSGLSVTEGYINAAEATAANSATTNSKEETFKYEVNRASFGSAVHTTNIGFDRTDTTIRVATSSTDTAYKVKPAIDSCSTVLTLANAGYITSADTDLLTFSNADDARKITHNGTISEFYIHSGTGVVLATDTKEVEGEDGEITTETVSIPLTGSFTTCNLTNNFDATLAEGEAYTIALDGAISVSDVNLDEGYYGAATKNNIITVSGINLSNESFLTVAHGKVTIASEGSTTIATVTDTAKAVEFVKAEDKETGVSYVELTATGSYSGKVSEVTPGYVKAGDISVDDTKNETTSDTVYIKKYVGEYVSGETTATAGVVSDAYSITIGQADGTIVDASSVTINTAKAYSQHNISVALSADAMGSSVVDAFEAFAARMNGDMGNMSVVL